MQILFIFIFLQIYSILNLANFCPVLILSNDSVLTLYNQLPLELSVYPFIAW